MMQEPFTSGIDTIPDDAIDRLISEVKYLSEEVRRLEIENYELRQELKFMELVVQDLQMGTPKGEMN